MCGKSKLLLIIFFSMLLVITFTVLCFGNSAEPPSILIIVPDAPDDLEISIDPDNANIKASMRDKIIERYYVFYSADLRMAKNYNINISTGEDNFEILLEEPMKTYNNIYMLNLENQTLTPGKSLLRSVLLVSLRIILTLIIEAIVFWLFGFRNKNSWIAFLLINFITQGALNIWLNGFVPLASYLVFSLIFAEFFVFIAEIVMFRVFIKEHSPGRALLYVIAANFMSLFAGGYIITILPV